MIQKFFTLDSSGENCGVIVCEPDTQCCLKCDKYGNPIPSGKCVDPLDYDSECPESHCQNLNENWLPGNEDSNSYLRPPISDDFLGNIFCTANT